MNPKYRFLVKPRHTSQFTAPPSEGREDLPRRVFDANRHRIGSADRSLIVRIEPAERGAHRFIEGVALFP